MTRDEYADLIKSSAQSVAVNAVYAWAVSSLPFLGWPIINQLLKYTLNNVFGYAIKQSELGLFFLYIDMRVGKQAGAFESAAEKNRIAQLTGSAKEKADAEATLISEFRTFAKFTS